MSAAPLALLLLRASRWFDRQLLAQLPELGWPALSPAQSLVFAYLDPEGTSPAELARRLGNTRQATSELVRGLVAHDLLALRPNPTRRGGLLITLTDRGRTMMADARRILRDLEAGLGRSEAVELRHILRSFEQPDPAAVPLALAPRTARSRPAG